MAEQRIPRRPNPDQTPLAALFHQEIRKMPNYSANLKLPTAEAEVDLHRMPSSSPPSQSSPVPKNAVEQTRQTAMC